MRTQRIAVIGIVLATLAIAYRSGILERFADPAGMTKTLLELGGWGYLAFVVAYALFQPFGVPGTVFIVAAPLIWPWHVAFALSMTGTMAASVVGFSFARLVARDFLAKRIPARFKRYDDALAARAFTTVFFLRLVFWMPPLLHAFFGVSKVRFWTHFWASLAGYVLPLLLVSFFGQKLFDTLKQAPPITWIEVGGGMMVLALGAWFVQQRIRRRNVE